MKIRQWLSKGGSEMRLVSISLKEGEAAGIKTEKGVYLLKDINQVAKKEWSTQIFSLLENEEIESLQQWINHEGHEYLKYIKPLREGEYKFGPLYRKPGKIWGIGLNYAEHAADLNEEVPRLEPASFMKPNTTIIGNLDNIVIPKQSTRTTAEAELGIIIGRKCKNVPESEARSVIAGFTAIIDMTAEDILEKNPRYLTRSKSFDTFFSLGPELITLNEIEDVMSLEVATVINGTIHRKNTVGNMRFHPWYLVSFHSHVMTLLPGDIISTGTPGAVVINQGDFVECRISGFTPLKNPVIDEKLMETRSSYQ
jgi:2-keto-4-pentenoate hydratase/2-oxohepta-3-ene-1,7-dioic acid hydratase in catechol pathway